MNLDFVATFLDIAEIEIPSDIQGKSLVPLFAKPKMEAWRDAIYYHYYSDKSWHLVKRHEGVRTKTHKLINFYDIQAWELYDLENDPHELNNKYASPENEETEKALTENLQKLRAKYKLPENILRD